MSFLTIFTLALALAMDAFAVSIMVGVVLPRLSFRPIFRLSWHFGLFQLLMPIIGWAAGSSVRNLTAQYDHWIAFGLLAFIGAKMMYESIKNQSPADRRDPTRGLSLIILSIATSIDALAVGFSMALLGVSVWFPCLIIGLIAGFLTVIGLHLGRHLGKRFGRIMEIFGGLILIAIGIKILIQHLTTT
ncbi:MAG: manganese efflux pump [Planctomycetes bacterium]|nr:manganese efflux pump [Planctomycetota bacterium]